MTQDGLPPRLRRRKARGFAMIEVLVTVLVIAFGLLGIVNLQLSVKRASHQTSQRTVAYTLANDMMERIRVNSAGASSYVTANALTGGTIAVQPACAGATCTAAETASRDLFNWERLLDSGSVRVNGANAGGLISPSGCVTFNAAPGLPAGTNTGQVSVIVTWIGLDEVQGAASAVAFYTGNPAACGFSPANDPDIARRQHVVLTSYNVAPEDLNR